MSHIKNYSQQDTEASPLIGEQSSREGPNCEEQYRRFREKYRFQFSLGWLLFLIIVGAITFAVNYSKMGHTPECDSDRKRSSALLLSFFFGVIGMFIDLFDYCFEDDVDLFFFILKRC